MTCQPSWLVSPACAGRYAPAASYGVLGGDRIADRPADRLPQAGVARHSERFAQGAGRHAVAVHDFVAGRTVGQIAVGRLVFHEVRQPPADVFPVGAFQVRMAGTQEGQQRQTGHRGIGVRAGAAAILALHARLAARPLATRVPTAVGRLVVGKPAKRRADGRLGLGVAAVTAQHARPVGRHAKAIAAPASHLAPPASRLHPLVVRASCLHPLVVRGSCLHPLVVRASCLHPLVVRASCLRPWR